jgi:hypothetical protein
MEIKKISYEEALARFKRSLEIRRNAERRMTDEWVKMQFATKKTPLWCLIM